MKKFFTRAYKYFLMFLALSLFVAIVNMEHLVAKVNKITETESIIEYRNIVKYDPNTGILYISGTISPVTVTNVLTIGIDRIETVSLDSVGGFYDEGKYLAYLINEHGINTYVPENGNCISACVLLFQAGKTRTAHKSAIFGLHSVILKSFNNGDESIDPSKTREYYDIIESYGGSSDLYPLATFYEKLIIDTDMAKHYNIVQHIEE